MAAELIRESETLLQKGSVPEATQSLFADTAKIVSRFGEVISFANLQDEAGQPASLSVEPSSVGVVILVKPGSLGESIIQIRQFGERFERLIASGKLALTVVFLDGDSAQQDWLTLSQQVKTTFGCRLLRCTALGTTRFLGAFPLRWSPSWIVLDADGRLLRFNSPLPVLESQLFDLLRVAKLEQRQVEPR